ncbi:MAG TPA: substrate-binding domain-containing protein [Candidatus Acidoferrales bacterium]|nr:substrate-binding domain-containing protein [Candidatus Acidoferrales bacterium]
MTGKSVSGRFLAFLTAVVLGSAGASAAQPRERKIVIAGAQSIAPLAEEFTAEFLKKYPGLIIEVGGGGSNYAVAAVRRDEIDIGLVSRTLTADEMSGLHVQSLGQDAIVVLTYPNNPLAGLTLPELRRIYTGQTVNWLSLGGEDRGIVALTRERSSGIHGLFVNRVFGRNFDGREKAFTIRASKEKILKTIKRVQGSVGYGILRIEQAEAEGVKVLKIDGQLPTRANIQSGLYPLTRPQSLIARRPARELASAWMREFARFASARAAERLS